jgi:hypothetical protein
MLCKSAVVFLLCSCSFSQTSDLALSTFNTAISANGTQQVKSIRLEGTALEHAGGDEAGAFIASIESSGRTNVRLNLKSGLREEQGSGLTQDPECSWTSPDGVKHEISLLNCWSLNNWLVPMVTLAADHPKIRYDLKSAEVPTLEFRRDMAGRTKDASTQADIEKLSEFRLSLDPKTLLPDKLEFTAHPDDDANVDIPIVIRYADYRTVNGVAVPFRIEKTMNGALVLELMVTSATIGGN